jgi:hypothetical protein
MAASLLLLRCFCCFYIWIDLCSPRTCVFYCSIVRQLIKSDGGHGDFQELALPLLGLWNTVMKVCWLSGMGRAG